MSGLPKGWAYTTLGAAIELKYGKSLPKGDRKEGPYNVFGSNGIVGTNQSSLSSAPAIVVGRKGSFGEVTYSAEKCFPIDTTYYVDEFDVVEPHFCYSLLKHLPLKSLNRATAIPGLNREDAYGLTFALPPLAEQKRIVAKLNALNAKSARARTELTRIETLVSRYKQAVLSKAFSGELTLAKGSNWASCTLGDLALDVRYGTAEKCTYAPDLTPVLRIPNVANGRIDLSDLKHASFNEKELRKLELLEGDLLIIRSNGSLDLVGRSAVVDAAAAGMLFAGYLIRVRLALSKVMPSFLQYWMQSFAVRRTIEDAAKSTSGVNNVNSKQLQALQLKLPTLEEQNEIVRRLETAFARIDRLAKEATRALELVGLLDEAILAKAFRGELVPQDDNDEPAERLLARIRAEREAVPKVKKRVVKRTSAMLTARDFLNAKLPNWPHDGISFQDLRSEFSGSYDDLKDAVFALLSDQDAPLRQVFDEQQSTMTLRRREQ
ncbi:restriction endonuclease subunit S [Agrobacterium tumefaciens]|uniref:restriction endonuclease subunit S n=1 Tax=Agrobacterium tumefaciens TaxID=358 RepID=UPI0021FC2BA7|nr:restriction endonuclease subunit S [Agrobacterium tumefaciens]